MKDKTRKNGVRRDGFETRLYNNTDTDINTNSAPRLYKNKYRIESARLKNWDYSSNGYYFITICTKNRECILGEIENQEMILNENGKIVETCWFDLPNHYNNLRLDEFIVMPNHIHGIMVIDKDIIPVPESPVETGFKPVSTDRTNNTQKRHGLFEFVRALKTFSSRRINKLRHSPGTPVWQSRFYDRIIRNENELNRIREYVINNPQNWSKDDNYRTTKGTSLNISINICSCGIPLFLL